MNSLSSTNVKAICAIVPIELTACTCVIWLASVPKVYTVFGAKYAPVRCYFFSWKAFHILVRQSKLLKTSITRAWLHSRRAQVLIWPVCSQTFHQLITFTFYSIPSVLLLALLFPHIFKTFHFISKT